MTYSEAVNYIKTLEAKNFIPNHQNSVSLMQYLGDFQNSMPVIHVAGTNGKGSTISYLRDILMAQGYSVGTFMSPHFFDYRELIEDNCTTITEEAFSTAATATKEACDKMVADGLPHPTAFECLVAIGLIHLNSQSHDFCIIEVGLGGKEDATNVFLQPLLSIITPISFDHEGILGDTLYEIAVHKAGIIKSGTPIVLAPNNIETISVVTEKVKEVDTYLYLLDEGLIHTHTFASSTNHKIFSIKTPFFEYKNLHTNMLGRHQEINIATALLAIKQLKKKYDISDEAVFEGIKKTAWPCRNELLTVNPLILLDGGHNPAGTEALKDLIEDHYSDRRIICVFGVFEDKSYQTMLDTVAAFSDSLVLTMPESDRALNPDTLAAHTSKPCTVIKDVAEALEHGLLLLDDNSMLVVTGSLSLTHPARVWLTEHLEL